MKLFLVSNISGSCSHHYHDKFWECYNHNLNTIGNNAQIYYLEGTPESQPDSITEREEKEGFSYLSKVYTIIDCIEKHDPDCVVWLDSTIKVYEPFFTNKVKPILEKDGVLILQDNKEGGEWWSSDRFLVTLGIDPASRETLKLPILCGGLWGVNLRHKTGIKFFKELKEYTNYPDIWFGPHGVPWNHDVVGSPELSLDTRVLGHRHDQCVIAYLSCKENLPTHDSNNDPILYTQGYINQLWKKNPNLDSYHFPVDAPAIQDPTKAHFSGILRDPKAGL